MTPSRGRGIDDEIYARRRRKRKRLERRRHRRRAVVLAVAAVVGLLFVVAGAAVTGIATFGSSCDLNSLQQVEIGSNTFIYAADNSRLGVIPAERNRQPVPLDEISPWMPKATVAIEDRRFYAHNGVDAEGIARALWKNVSAGQVVEGGSTITQQLVRNLYIGRERTVERKLKEACLALKLDNAWAKNRILATYMNQVYYGNLAYGIEAAAQTYFSKHARELNLPQAALLAGLPQAPSDYDPFRQAEIATGRRNQVLRALLTKGDIDRAQFDWAVSRGLGLKAGKLYKEIREPDFFGYVRDQLIAEYGAGTVRSGGLKVYTTIDPRFQRAAQAAIRETLYDSDDPAAGVISINPKNGAIRAMTAVIPGNTKNQFNLLSQGRRQSGSTFKTFVLAAAVEQGINPATTSYRSAPFYYRPDPNGSCDDGTWWCPETYDHSYTGWTTIERATLRSDNTVYAQLTLDVTPEKVAEMATQARRALAAHRSKEPSCRRSGSVRWMSRRSTWRPRMPRSLRAGSTRSRWRSGRSSFRTARTRAPAGASRSASASFRTGSRTPSRGSSSRTSTTAPASAPTTAIPPRARRVRPRSGPTRGSAAIRRDSGRPSGWAIRRPRSR